jgi:2-iminobutanoate/2-iminopropanoate deaminase
MIKVIFTKKSTRGVLKHINNFLFVSVQIPVNGKNIEDQTREVMDNLKNILSKAKITFNQVIKRLFFFQKWIVFLNKIYSEYFDKARETIEVSLLPQNKDIEISMVAYKM